MNAKNLTTTKTHWMKDAKHTSSDTDVENENQSGIPMVSTSVRSIDKKEVTLQGIFDIGTGGIKVTIFS